MVHQSVSRGLAVFADAWLSGWVAEISADLRENGSALEVVPRRCAIQIHDFTLLYLLKNACMDLDEMLHVDRCRDLDELINF